MAIGTFLNYIWPIWRKCGHIIAIPLFLQLVWMVGGRRPWCWVQGPFGRFRCQWRTFREQEPINRNVQLPFFSYATAFSQINFFFSSIFSTFPRENGSTFPYACVSVGTIKEVNAIKTSKILFLVSGFWWLICKTYFKFKLCEKIELKMNWSVKTPLHRHKGGARSGLWAPYRSLLFVLTWFLNFLMHFVHAPFMHVHKCETCFSQNTYDYEA